LKTLLSNLLFDLLELAMAAAYAGLMGKTLSFLCAMTP